MRTRTKENLLRAATAAVVACAAAVILLPAAAASAQAPSEHWAAVAFNVISPVSAG